MASATNSASASTNSPCITEALNLQMTPIHHLINIKLDTHNYLLWQAQFEPVLIAYGYDKFVDGTSICPSKLATDGTANPEYMLWVRKDKILLGWLLSSLSESVLAQVVGLKTSKAVWDALGRIMASKSKSRLMYLRRELQTIRKGSLTMADYFLKVKRLGDALAASGEPIRNSDLQQMLLSGLDSSYDAIVTTLTATLNEVPMDDFQAHLLAFEMRLDSQNSTLHSNNVLNVANVASRQNYNKNGSNNQARNSGGQNKSNTIGQPRSYPSKNGEGPCQICGKPSHAAFACWHRFEHNYQSPLQQTRQNQQPRQNQQQVTSSGPNNGHQAYVARTNPPHEFTWHPDSGATNHLTNNLSNLQLYDEYDGPDTIRVGSAHADHSTSRIE